MSSSGSVEVPPPPFTFTNSIDSQSFQSIISTMSENAANPLTGSLSPEQSSIAASFSSMMAGLSAKQSADSAVSSTLITSTILSQSGPSSHATVTSMNPSSQITSTGVGASNTAPRSGSLATSSGTSSPAGPTASSAASNSTADLQKHSTAGLHSPGLKAAVAVPVVVVGLAVIALIFCCMRRRKRKNQNEDTMEKMPNTAERKKKWSRHLRIFSFDAELLMGGRFSSTNSIRSRQTGSLRSETRSQHTPVPSEHSVESEVAPPYRDALAAGGGVGVAGARAAHNPSPLGRSVSNATAPPPYLAPGTAGNNHLRPTSTRSNRDPFADTTAPISPVEGSPFNDPVTPALSRNSSILHSDRGDNSTIGGASDAGSIREATLARNASVASGGRIIDNVTRRAS